MTCKFPPNDPRDQRADPEQYSWWYTIMEYLKSLCGG